MRVSLFTIVIMCFWVWVLPVSAADGPESSDEVVIGDDGDQVINEFRVNGQLYMIQVTPKKGPPYYLMDSDGDGDLETRRNELSPNLLIPNWVLKRW